MKPVFTKHPQKGSAIFLVPSIITLGAMCAGFFAVFSAIDANYIKASYLIFLAMILDSLDGRVARMTHTSSPFGAQLDSLSDMVNFGFAPAMIIYYWQLHTLGKIGSIVVFMYAASAALRLARFNTMLSIVDKKYFIGLPSTSAAPLVVGYVWLCNYFAFNSKPFIILGVFITIFTAVLMVSNVKFYSFKEFNFHHRAKFRALLIFLFLLALLVIFPELVIYLFFVIYTIICYLYYFYRKYIIKNPL
jgi:CDP-diacylglycerol--serine O-phosphatidyltransferase